MWFLIRSNVMAWVHVIFFLTGELQLICAFCIHILFKFSMEIVGFGDKTKNNVMTQI